MFTMLDTLTYAMEWFPSWRKKICRFKIVISYITNSFYISSNASKTDFVFNWKGTPHKKTKCYWEIAKSLSKINPSGKNNWGQSGDL